MTETSDSAAQTTALTALLEGTTHAEAAKRAGVSERTISRWMQDPGFKRALQRANQEAAQEAIAMVHGSLKGSVADLLKLQRDSETPAGARVRSVKVLFDIARQAQDDDFALRLERAEAALADAGALLEKSYGVTDGTLFDVS